MATQNETFTFNSNIQAPGPGFRPQKVVPASVPTSTAPAEEFLTEEQKKTIQAELGLAIPAGVITESIPLWRSFFEVIMMMYEAEMITKEDVPGYLSDFFEVPDTGKEECISELRKVYRDKVYENITMKELWLAERTRLVREEILEALENEELRNKFLYYMDTGQEMPEELVRVIREGMGENLTPEEVEEYAIASLSEALNRKPLNLGRQYGQALTPEAVGEMLDTAEQTQVPKIDQISQQSQQSVYANQAPVMAPSNPEINSAASQNRQPQAYYPAPNQSQNYPQNPNPNYYPPQPRPAPSLPVARNTPASGQVRSKINGLDDLLKK